MDLSKYRLIRLTEDHKIRSFDCGDKDLNDFLLDDAKNCLADLLYVTYILEDEYQSIAFFSLANDRISCEDVHKNNDWRRFVRRLPVQIQLRSYPAVKIGRLAVNSMYQNQSIGTQVLDYLKASFITNNKTGCMYITVDAYRASSSFYLKNGFLFLSKHDEWSETRLMYYNLAELK